MYFIHIYVVGYNNITNMGNINEDHNISVQLESTLPIVGIKSNQKFSYILKIQLNDLIPKLYEVHT